MRLSLALLAGLGLVPLGWAPARAEVELSFYGGPQSAPHSDLSISGDGAIPDLDVLRGEANIVEALTCLHEAGAELPLLFVRVRHVDQIPDLCHRLGPAVDALVLRRALNTPAPGDYPAPAEGGPA